MSWTRPSYFRYGKLTGTSPWDVFSRLTALKLPAAGYGAGIVLFVLILIGMAAQPRFFCQFLCPMGAVFALLPVLPFAWLHRNGTRCIPGCSACAKRCPVDLKLDDANLRGGECIVCEACIGTCPKGNISRWDIRLSGESSGCRCSSRRRFSSPLACALDFADLSA